MKLNMLILALLTVCRLCAQERPYMGRVIDKDTRQGIPFCVVKVKDRNEGVYTDDAGRFAFTANTDSAKTFIFYCLGYTKVEIPSSQMGTDSVTVTMQKEYSSLKEVVVSDDNGGKTAWMGKKKSKHVSDCYQKYGGEIAAFERADKARNGVLKEVYVYITDEGVPDSKFRIHIYSKDSATNMPAEELTDSNVIVHATKGNEWVKTDLSNRHIHVGEGVFISVEWVSGHGNADKAMQSMKHPIVDAHNGQVLGLTKNTFKKWGSRYMYQRDPFNSSWHFSFNPMYCPMVYARYTYHKR